MSLLLIVSWGLPLWFAVMLVIKWQELKQELKRKEQRALIAAAEREFRVRLHDRHQLRITEELKSLPPARDHEHRLWNLNCRSDGSPVFPKEEA